MEDGVGSERASDLDRAAEEGRRRVREALASFEDVEERLSHGEAAWIAAAPGAQEALTAAQPGRYFRPPYVGHRGWVGAYLDTDCDWEAIGGLLALAVELARASGRRRA